MRLKISTKTSFVTDWFVCLTILGIITLAAALVIAGDYPWQGGYEADLYRAYPPVFWALLITCLLCGYAILFREAFATLHPPRWVWGALLIASVNTLVLSLPLLRHYAFTTQWDSVNHFSRALSLLEEGWLFSDNFYPIVHLLAASLALLTGLRLEVVLLLLPVVFYWLFLANVVFLSWTLAVETRQRILMLALATPLIIGNFSTIFRPVLLAIYTLPLFAAWLFKSHASTRGSADAVPYLLILMALPLIHPWGTAAAILLLGCLIVAPYLTKLVSSKFADPFYKLRNLSNSLILVFVIGLAWFGSFFVSRWAAMRLLGLLLQINLEGHQFQTYLSAAQRVDLPITRILSLVLFRYGPTLLYFLPVYLLAGWYLVVAARGERKLQAHRLALIAFTLIFSVISLVSIFTKILVDDPRRTMGIAAVFAPLWFVPWLFDLKDQHKRLYRWLLAILLVTIPASGSLGILNAYSSPLVGAPNLQFSYAEQAGARFIVDHYSVTNRSFYAIINGAQVFNSALNYHRLGVINYHAATKEQTRPGRLQTFQAPAHFGRGFDYLGLVFEKPDFLWITAYERAFYTQIWPSGGRFESQDFTNLELDPAWHKIYTSNDFELWRSTGIVTKLDSSPASEAQP